MKLKVLFLLGFTACMFSSHKNNDKKILSEYADLPIGIKKLLKAYPQHFKSGTPNTIIWQDGTEMFYDDGQQKTFEVLLDIPDLEDQVMAMPYVVGKTPPPQLNDDPGRVRNEAFFKKMYGDSPEAVKKNLVEIIWLPKTVKQKLLVSKINGIDKKFKAISDALDGKPHLRKYLENVGGTFTWRKIAGTDRLSTHSFGTTIDINIKFSHYWQWDYKNWKTDPSVEKNLKWRNLIPQEIVDVFEQNGFIWGGKWYHYDTMHFEYRPELFVKI